MLFDFQFVFFVVSLGNCTGGNKKKADAMLARNAVMPCLQNDAINAFATSYNAVGASFQEMHLRKGKLNIGFAIKMFLTVFGAAPQSVIVNFLEMMVKHGCFAGVTSRSKQKIHKAVTIYLRESKKKPVKHKVTCTRPRVRQQDNKKIQVIFWAEQMIIHFDLDTLEQDDKDAPSYVIEAEELMSHELKVGTESILKKLLTPKVTDQYFNQLRKDVLAKCQKTLAMPFGSQLGQEVFGDNKNCWGEEADERYKHQLFVCTRVATASVNAEWCPIPHTRFGYRRSALQWSRKLSTFNFELVQDSQLHQLEGSDFSL